MKPTIKKMSKGLRKVGYGVTLSFVMANICFASEAGGNMPWEGPLQKIMDSISGPVAKTLGVIVIVIADLGIAFGESVVV